MMPVSGKGKRKVLIIAEAPGSNEDRQGIQLIGNAGMKLVELLEKIDIDMRVDCWLTNAVICRPSDSGGNNRKPKNEEINFCRPNLSKTIKELQPNVIIPLGKASVQSLIPLAWKTGEVDDATTWVGWQIPSVKLNSWICPTYHPSFLLHGKDPVAEMHVLRHLKAAFTYDCKPWPILPDWESKVSILMNPKLAAKEIAYFANSPRPTAFDYETTTLKPDGPYAEILCCSISNGERTIVYPWQGEAIKATSDFLKSTTPKVAANLRFEERWTRKFLKHGVFHWWKDMGDIVLGAHWRDYRPDICSLKFQAFVYFGIDDYDYQLAEYRKCKDGKRGNAPNRLKEVEPKVLLTYCGLDSLFEVMVAHKLLGEKR